MAVAILVITWSEPTDAQASPDSIRAAVLITPKAYEDMQSTYWQLEPNEDPEKFRDFVIEQPNNGLDATRGM